MTIPQRFSDLDRRTQRYLEFVSGKKGDAALEAWVRYTSRSDSGHYTATVEERIANAIARAQKTTLSSLVTPEGVRVEVGQVWRDLDRRSKDKPRLRVIIALDPSLEQVFMGDHPDGGGQRSWVRVNRMRKYSKGWALVEREVPGEAVSVEPESSPPAA